MTTRNSALESLYFQLNDLQFDFRNKNLNNLVFSKIKGKSLIDVGCGVGHFLMLAKSRGMNVQGIEPNLELIKLGKSIYKNLDIQAMTAEESSMLKKKFDNVVLIDVIEHIKDDVGILKNVRNLLKEKGRLIIITSAYPFLYGVRDKKVGHFRRYSKEELVGKLKKSSYDIQEVRYWDAMGFLPYFFLEKVFKNNLLANLRQNRKRSVLLKIINFFLDLWFKKIENNFDFNFGLTLMAIATTNKK